MANCNKCGVEIEAGYDVCSTCSIPEQLKAVEVKAVKQPVKKGKKK
jgi:hypothetical protein